MNIISRLALAIAALVFTGAQVAIPAPSTAAASTPVYACQYEDGSGQPLAARPCIWSARDMGNGRGAKSMMVKRSGKVITISNARAHRLFTQGR